MRKLLAVLFASVLLSLSSYAQNIWDFSVSPGVLNFPNTLSGPFYYSDGTEPDTLTASGSSTFSNYTALTWTYTNTAGYTKMAWEFYPQSGYVKALGYDRVISIPACKVGEIISIEYTAKALAALPATEFVSPTGISTGVSTNFATNLKLDSGSVSVVSSNSGNRVIADFRVVADGVVNIISGTGGYCIYKICKGASLTPVFKLSASRVEFSKEANTTEKLLLTAENIGYWTANSDQAWLQVSPGYNSVSDSLSLKVVEENTTGVDREAVVSLVNVKKDTLLLRITQSKDSPFLNLSTDTISLKSTKYSKDTLSLASNVSWTATSNKSWLKLNPSYGLSDTSIVLTALSSNEDDTIRTAIISLQAKGMATKQVHVSQANLYKFINASTDTVKLSAYANVLDTIKVASNVAWTASTTASFCTLARSTTDTTLLIINPAVNTGGVERVGSITLTGSGKQKTLYVLQSAKYLAISPSATELAKTAGSVGTLTVTATVAWQASSNQSWLQLSKTGGSGSSTLSYSASANTSYASRTAIISLSAAGVPTQTVAITQSPTIRWDFNTFPATTTGYYADTTINNLTFVLGDIESGFGVTYVNKPVKTIGTESFAGYVNTAGFSFSLNAGMPYKRYLKFQTIAASTITVWFKATSSSTPSTGIIADGTQILASATDNGVGTKIIAKSTKAGYIYIGGSNATTIYAISADNVKTKIDPKIIWTTTSPINTMTTLSNIQLNATASVPGSFTYTPGVGTKLSAGTHKVYLHFVPTDTAKYEQLSDSMNITVIKQKPVVTWAAQANITYGTPLTDAHFSASANIPGLFVYKQQVGDVLNAGLNLLSAEFIPTDSINFDKLICTTSILVKKQASVLSWQSPSGIVYGSALSSAQLNAQANVAGSLTYTPAEGTQLSAGQHALVVNFTPTDTLNYLSATDTVSLQVAKALPVFAWSNPANIVYGTALSSTQLNAQANVVGGYTYIPAEGAVLTAGKHALVVNFAPADTLNYLSAADTVSLTVAKALPVLTWSNPSAIVYGSALSSTQLNAQANVAGGFAYSPAAGEVISAGVHALVGIFTPTDTLNYLSAADTVSLVVNKALPVLTWSNPANTVYGNALSSVQLNAQADVAGGFAYTPTEGTVLTAGQHTLVVNFTPTDTLNYLLARDTASLVVDKALPVLTWSNPDNIVYGTALSSTQLNAQTEVAGKFVYTPADSTLLSAGTHTLSTVFTPADLANYQTVSATVAIEVNKALPVLQWVNPTEMHQGTALTEVQLNATASVAGSFVYTPALNTVLPEGKSQQLSCTFVPADAVNYESVSATVSVNVIADAEEIPVYPNPVVDEFRVPTLETQAVATISDFSGKVVLTQTLAVGQSINVSGIKAGVYFILIKTNNNSYKTKFIKL